ncbi:glycosyltransferase family 4 protein (plasmid) [Pedobacter sp. BS3]|nr:glycosyltransferase family 4 protein [Pedobacter sp. BS3]
MYHRDHIDEIAAILKRWYTNRDILRQYQQQARLLAAGSLNWEEEAKRLLQLSGEGLRRKRKLHIVLTVDPEIPVPPLLYGGIERMVYLLVNGLVSRGHQVTVFANPLSDLPCQLVSWKGHKSRPLIDTLHNMLQLTGVITKVPADVVHSFSRLAYLTFLLPRALPKLMSYQREPTQSQIRKAVLIARKNSLCFTGCSRYITRQITQLAPAHTIYNAVNSDYYTFKETVPTDAPLIFLGRIESIKGTHLAIELAIRTGKRLWIAGNIPPEGISYFAQEVKPYLNEQIEYLGPVNDTQKNTLLGQALALLMPIQWDEPFGIVMIEAMACGTPVLGFNRGAVPEIVEPGINGYVCSDLDDMEYKLAEVATIDRKIVRESMVQQFSADVIVAQYLELYEEMARNKVKDEVEDKTEVKVKR